MSSDQYTPSDEEVRTDYVMAYADRDSSQLLAGMAFDRWLAAHDARVRRDAAREALDGLAEQFDSWAEGDAGDVARAYRDTHYPEETPNA